MAMYHEIFLQEGILTVCQEIWPDEIFKKVYFTAIFVFLYAIPLILIIVCYLFIGFRVWNRNAPGIFKSNGVIHKSKVKVVKMLAVVVFIFVISWIPNYIIRFWLYFQMDPVRDYEALMFLVKYVIPIAQWMGVSNSGINPVIYCLFSKKIRLRIKAMLKCHSKHFLERSASQALRPHGIEKRRKSSMGKSCNSSCYD